MSSRSPRWSSTTPPGSGPEFSGVAASAALLWGRMTQCVHGMDTRFCSLCNRPAREGRRGAPRGAVGDATLSEILQFLNHQQVRATYGAVAEILGVIHVSMGALLGPHSAEASWIVSAATGLPTDYRQDEMHPALLRRSDIIQSGIELAFLLATWKASRKSTEN